MQRVILTLLIAILFDGPSYAQKFDFVKLTPGIRWSAVKCDLSGDVVAAGYFSDTVTLGGKKHGAIGTTTYSDVIIAKFSRLGEVIWSYSSGGNAPEFPRKIAFDRSANIYLLGGYTVTGLLQPAFGGSWLPRVAANFFIAKFSPSGEFLWVRCPQDTTTSSPDFSVSSEGEITLEGYFKGTLHLGQEQVTATSPLGSLFLTRIATDGKVRWLKEIAKNDTIGPGYVREDRNGHILLIKTLTRRWHLFGHVFDRPDDSSDIVVARLSADALYDTVWQFGGKGQQQLSAAEVDASGNIYMVAAFTNEFKIGDSVYKARYLHDKVLFKVDRFGKVLWSRRIGSDVQLSLSTFGVDRGGLTYSQTFSGTINIEGRSLTSTGLEIATIRLDANGKFRWVLRSSDPNSHNISQLDADGQGGLYATGFVNSIATFGNIVVDRGTLTIPNFILKISEPAILTNSPEDLEYCPGDNITVRFNTIGSSGNSYSAFLSDSNGSFEKPIAIGQFSGKGDSIIVGQIPRTSLPGTGYRIRVSTTSAPELGYDNGPYFTVHMLPDLVLEARKPVSFCEGGTVPLVASGAERYLWSTGDTLSTITVNSGGWYSVRAWNEFGCEARDSIKLTSHPYPVASVNASGPTTFCQGGHVILSAKGGKTYSWSNGEKTASIIVKSSGEYYVSAKGDGDCADESERINVIVHPLPAKPEITKIDDTLRSSSSYGNEWYLAGGSRVDTTQQFRPSKTGKYYVRVTDSNGCVAQSDFIDVVVEQNHVAHSAIEKFEVSPNPAKDVITIAVSSSDRVTIEIVDLLGFTLYSGSIPAATTEPLIINTIDWSSGVYYVRALAGEELITRKLVKH